jgi:hypothetical protein
MLKEKNWFKSRKIDVETFRRYADSQAPPPAITRRKITPRDSPNSGSSLRINYAGVGIHWPLQHQSGLTSLAFDKIMGRMYMYTCWIQVDEDMPQGRYQFKFRNFFSFGGLFEIGRPRITYTDDFYFLEQARICNLRIFEKSPL